MTDKSQMLVNKRYKITLDDCCISGHVVGTFLGWIGDSDPEWADARSDIGIIGPYWGRWSVEEVHNEHSQHQLFS